MWEGEVRWTDLTSVDVVPYRVSHDSSRFDGDLEIYKQHTRQLLCSLGFRFWKLPALQARRCSSYPKDIVVAWIGVSVVWTS